MLKLRDVKLTQSPNANISIYLVTCLKSEFRESLSCSVILYNRIHTMIQNTMIDINATKEIHQCGP